MRNNAYWSQRVEEVQRRSLLPSELYDKELERQYKKAIKQINADINAWVNRVTVNNKVSRAKAKEMIKGAELEEFRWTVEEYIARARENKLDQRWIKELENASGRYHITRLEAIRLQMEAEIRDLYQEREAELERVLTDIYKDSYYRNTYEVSRGAGYAVTLDKIDDRAVKTIVRKPWAADGMTFSDRIWTQQKRLQTTLSKELNNAINNGYRMEKAVEAITDRFNVSQSEARRLVMTESAFFSSLGQEDSFKELGVKRYIYVSTLDTRTSPTCQDLDGKIFEMSKREVGVNAPPMHPWCRSTTAPYYEDLKGLGRRAMRNPKTGKTVRVPRDITYHEWHTKYVEGI